MKNLINIFSIDSAPAKLFKHDLNLSLSNYYEALYNIKSLSVFGLRSAQRAINHCRKERKIVCFAHNTAETLLVKLFIFFFSVSSYFLCFVIFHTPSDIIAKSYDKAR